MKTKEEGLLATLAVLGIAALVAYLFPDHFSTCRWPTGLF